MSGRRSIRPSLVLGLALGGVLLGHTLAYRLLLPDAHARTIELARSGHGYLAGANVVGLAAAIAALAALFLGRLLRSEDAETSSILWRLIAFQVTTFASMEALERIASGAGGGRLLPVLAIGLPVQSIVAASIALLARLLLRAAAGIAGRASRVPSWSRAAAIAIHPRDEVLPAGAMLGRPRGRAPPSVPVPA